MKRIDVEDVIAINADYDGSLLFGTRDGEYDGDYAYLDNQGFFVLDEGDEFEEPDHVYVAGKADPIFAICGVTTDNRDKEKVWTDDIDQYLATYGLKLGEFHYDIVVVNGDYFFDGWFDIESI